MTYATRPSLQARIPKSRNSLSNNGRIALKVLTGGLAAAGTVFMTVTAVMVGAGWVFGLLVEARSDLRSVVALARPSDGLAWTGQPAGGMASQAAVLATLSSPATKRPAKAAVFDPMGALAMVIPDSSDTLEDRSLKQAYTGSIGPYSSRLADVASAEPPGSAPRLDDVPLPRTRPRLAALPPIEDLGVKPEEDARSLRTAIYDITAQTVYLPSGERLEAHSGLGNLMDDPRHVRQKNRGATPPNTYELKLRESLFHGVRAIRLTPVGDGDMFDRDGILAHSYMLGASGQSNGCVSFKDYPKFLRAYLRGEIDRIVVVSRLTKPPVFATRPNARSANNTL